MLWVNLSLYGSTCARTCNCDSTCEDRCGGRAAGGSTPMVTRRRWSSTGRAMARTSSRSFTGTTTQSRPTPAETSYSTTTTVRPGLALNWTPCLESYLWMDVYNTQNLYRRLFNVTTWNKACCLVVHVHAGVAWSWITGVNSDNLPIICEISKEEIYKISQGDRGPGKATCRWLK